MKSDNVKKGMQQAPHRSLFNALGYTKEELDRPLVGIVSSYNEIVLFGGYGFCGYICGGLGYRESARLVSGKLFRDELEQREGCFCIDCCHRCDYLPLFQANRCVPAWRSLCEKRRSQYPSFSCASDPALQYAVGLCDRICRTGFFCWDRGSVSG